MQLHKNKSLKALKQTVFSSSAFLNAKSISLYFISFYASRDKGKTLSKAGFEIAKSSDKTFALCLIYKV